jgi:hypothetical protein
MSYSKAVTAVSVSYPYTPKGFASFEFLYRARGM